MALTFCMTYFTLGQLIQLHEFELLNAGKRYGTYHELGRRAFRDVLAGEALGYWRRAIRDVLGKDAGEALGYWIIFPLQMVVEVGLDILYTVAAGEAMNRIHGNLSPHHPVHLFVWFAVFAAIQIILSFVLPTFHSIRWIVVAGAIMSICYTTIAWITIISTENPFPVPLAPTPSSARDQVFKAFSAIGVISYAYSAHNVALEIQNGIPSTTLRSSEKEMLSAVRISYLVVGLCYFPMAIAVYVKLGDRVCENVLELMFHWDNVPKGFFIAANLMLIIHLIGSYQIFALPVFTQLEILLKSSSSLIRPMYIVTTTFLAMAFPYFIPLLGFFGGFAIAPTTYFLPCIIWLLIKKPKRWSREWCFNWAFIILGVLFMICATSGGLYVLVKEQYKYKLFTSSWREDPKLYSRDFTCS